MKISIERDALLNAMDAVRGIVEARSTIPILTNVLLDASNGRLTITATNLDIEATTTVAADVASGSVLTVPAVMLADITKRLSKGAVVHLETSGHQLVVKSGRAKFTLGTLPASDWPEAKKVPDATCFHIDPEILTAALAKTKFAISNEETRYYLNGVYMVRTDGQLTFVSTDGHRLARYEIEPPEGIPAFPGVIIPTKACVEFAKLAIGSKEPLSIEVAPSRVTISDGVTTIGSKTIDGSFPDYQRVIPRNNDKIATVDRRAMADGASRVSTVATDRGRAVKCSFHDGSLDLSVSSSDGGEAFDSIDAEFDAGEITTGYNAKYLADVLGAFDGDEIRIALNDAGSPALLTSEANPELTIIIMPMRVG